MRNGKVIDADGHVRETHPGAIDWDKYLEPEYRWGAPQLIPFPTGGGRWFLDGRIWHTPLPGGGDVKGQATYDIHTQRVGMADPQKRMPDMDAEGIDIAVLFGGSLNIGISGVRNPGLGLALARAYNRWVADYCKAAPERLKATTATPLQNIEGAIDEINRAVTQDGFVGVCVPPNVGGVSHGFLQYDPVYAEAERLGVPLCIHAFRNSPGVVNTGQDRFDKLYYFNLISMPVDMMITVATMISEGALDRHPKLKVAFLEGGCGWFPFLAQRMDEHYEQLASQVQCKAKPSEYLSSPSVFISFDSGEETLHHAVEAFGEDKLVYASDYWHHDAGYFGSVKKVQDNPHLSATAKRKALYDNAARLYSLNGKK